MASAGPQASASARQAETGVPQYGVSQPICTRAPTEKDLKLSNDVSADLLCICWFQLKDCLRSYNVFENEEELQKRLDVLRRINSLVRQWVRQVSEGKVSISALILKGSVVCFFLLFRVTSDPRLP